jgi:hypothetical protein
VWGNDMIEITIKDIEKNEIVYQSKHESMQDFVEDIIIDKDRIANTQKLTFEHLYRK